MSRRSSLSLVRSAQLAPTWPWEAFGAAGCRCCVRAPVARALVPRPALEGDSGRRIDLRFVARGESHNLGMAPAATAALALASFVILPGDWYASESHSSKVSQISRSGSSRYRCGSRILMSAPRSHLVGCPDEWPVGRAYRLRVGDPDPIRDDARVCVVAALAYLRYEGPVRISSVQRAQDVPRIVFVRTAHLEP